MKKLNCTTLILIACLCNGCVQKTDTKTVVFMLNAKQIKDVKLVTIKGNDKPLSWGNGLEMNPIVQDSFYSATVTFKTGYKFIEMKFLVNNNFELNDLPNRRVYFSEKDTTIYCATFDKRVVEK